MSFAACKPNLFVMLSGLVVAKLHQHQPPDVLVRPFLAVCGGGGSHEKGVSVHSVHL